MKLSNFILGIVCVFLGIGLVLLYNDIARKGQKAGLTFKLRVGGIGLVIIGLGLIFRSCE